MVGERRRRKGDGKSGEGSWLRWGESMSMSYWSGGSEYKAMCNHAMSGGVAIVCQHEGERKVIMTSLGRSFHAVMALDKVEDMKFQSSFLGGIFISWLTGNRCRRWEAEVTLS